MITMKSFGYNRGRKVVRYPWDDWFGHKSFTLKKGEDGDYNCATHGMAAQIRNVADARQVRVSLRIEENGAIHVTVRGKK